MAKWDTESHAYKLGFAAMKNGKKRVPALSKPLMDFLNKDGKIGDSGPDSNMQKMSDWVRGWDDANISNANAPHKDAKKMTETFIRAVRAGKENVAQKLFSRMMQESVNRSLAKLRSQALLEGYTKKALIRDPNAPIGQPATMHLNCICGTKVIMGPDGGECAKCGQRYDPQGWLKEAVDRGGWKTIKTITSHQGKFEFMRNLDAAGNIYGWVPNPSQIPSPYSYGPSRAVYSWNGKHIIIMETAHKRFEIIAVPTTVKIYDTDDEASAAYIKKT